MWTLATRTACVLSLAWTSASANDIDCVDYTKHQDQLQALADLAHAGRLDPSIAVCLEASYLNAESSADRAAIAEVLLPHTYLSNTRRWAWFAKQHLETLAEAPPQLAYLYAHHLFHREKQDLGGALQWAQRAYAQRLDTWEGDAYIERSHQLLKLMAQARLRQWEQAERDGLAGDKKARTAATELKLQAQSAAREWLDFDRASGLNWRHAAETCLRTGAESGCGLVSGWQGDVEG
jgi:hypothetical protein